MCCVALRCGAASGLRRRLRAVVVGSKASRDPASARGGQREQGESEASKHSKTRARVDAFIHGSEQERRKPWASWTSWRLRVIASSTNAAAITTCEHHLVPCHVKTAVPCKKRDSETTRPELRSCLGHLCSQLVPKKQDFRLAKGACIAYTHIPTPYIPAQYYLVLQVGMCC